MKIQIDRGRCTGIGMCEAISPDYFEVDDDGVLQLIAGEEVPETAVDEVNEAIRACPKAALSWSAS
ncbi:ferredoxin [Leucobacter soli]|uniref:Ferredoxin n=1 Tax=Leucobacter soli TaxID=2812850 RepID=A0A916NWQ2_9MICO|nr:ferredoxin [Leucobacter soli]CAG7618748.1 hypothetical protein LEUCIP111803_02230 [Leucobacter soli]